MLLFVQYIVPSFIQSLKKCLELFKGLNVFTKKDDATWTTRGSKELGNIR